MTMTSAAPSARLKPYENRHQCFAAINRANLLFLQRAVSMRVGPPSAIVVEESMEAEVEVFPQQTSPFNKKRVWFGANSVTVVPRVENQSALWWDQVDFAARRSLDNAAVDRHSKKEGSMTYREAVLYLMKSFQSENQSREELIEHVRTVRAANVRGLEARIVPFFKASRSYHVREILKLQKKFEKGDIRPEMAATMLRRKSLILSRASRQFAFRMAQSDRLDVKEQLNG